MLGKTPVPADASVAGDALVVESGVAHHFEDLADGFAAWVVFAGPSHGDAARAAPEGPERDEAVIDA